MGSNKKKYFTDLGIVIGAFFLIMWIAIFIIKFIIALYGRT